MQTDVTGRTHVFNSVRLDLTAALPEIIASGVAALRARRAHGERRATRRRRSRPCVAAREAVMAGRVPAERREQATTSGHFFRGLT